MWGDLKMSRAKLEQRHPSGTWRRLMPDRLAIWRLFRVDLEPLGLTADRLFRETPSTVVVRAGAGGFAARYELHREDITGPPDILGEVLRRGAAWARQSYKRL